MSRSERALLAAALGGDRRAWDELVDRHLESTWRQALASGLPPPFAGDIVQAVWRNAALALGALARGGDISAYLAFQVAAEVRRTRAMAGRSPFAADDPTDGAAGGPVDAGCDGVSPHSRPHGEDGDAVPRVRKSRARLLARPRPAREDGEP